MKYALVFGLCGLVLSLLGPLSSALGVDPIGRPTDLKKKEGNGYFLWYEDGEWHLRTRRQNEGAVFQGTIHVLGGRITDCWVEGAKREKADNGWLNDAHTTLTFSLKTGAKAKGAEGRDGFGFKVSGSAQQISFKLSRTPGPTGPKIRIGANNEPPSEQYEAAREREKPISAASFSLPAHPERTPDKGF